MAGALGWGLDRWGFDRFGGLSGPLFVVSALPLSTRSVRVTLSVPPAAVSVSAAGDALNPATWSIIRTDTGAAFTVASIDLVTPTVFDILVVEAFGSSFVTHRVSSLTLVKSTGESIEAPHSADFVGVVASDTIDISSRLAKGRFIAQDLANPPFPPGQNNIGGTLVMTSGGDYANVKGSEFVKKLIIRRLTTRLGEFSHLPNYGLGALVVKEPLSTTSLILSRREAVRQILREPEVAQASVVVSVDPGKSIFTMIVSARLKTTGESLKASFQLPSTGVL